MRWKELFFTGFYTGYSPVAPGTVGTILALFIYIIEYIAFGSISWIINLIVVLILIYPSIKLGDEGEKFFSEKDPSQVVLDEMMGYWISLMFYPFNIKIVIAAFIIFRFFDIVKPYPVRKLENMRGGLGIMLDDYISGVYTNIILFLILIISRYAGVDIY